MDRGWDLAGWLGVCLQVVQLQPQSKPQLAVIRSRSNVCLMCPQAMAAATRVLCESSMKLNPEVDGTINRVPIPKVSTGRNLVKQFSNKAKESLRRVRSNAVTQVKKVKETVSEDTIRLVEKQVTLPSPGRLITRPPRLNGPSDLNYLSRLVVLVL
ncbi:hypothetical protein J4Q44_G00131480 [Coregonus suidteri]|uniref:Ribosome-recycling factor, mitochondrial n=1 Tax=Coregonus suidteri TaxID=861788 RepID=A0AAN8LT02_9TELE